MTNTAGYAVLFPKIRLTHRWRKPDSNPQSHVGFAVGRADRETISISAKESPSLFEYAGRSLGQCAALVGTCLYLASAASDYVTGAVIPVDGGYTASDGLDRD